MLKVTGVARVLIESAVIVVLCGGTALAVNALRSTGRLPLIQRTAYQILVPCPEVGGEVGVVAASSALLSDPAALVVDARGVGDYSQWHWPSALSIVFDYLSPVSADAIRTVANARVRRILVYGDGQDPDSGKELARVLSSGGIKNVSFVEGGAPALIERCGKGPCP